jgi:acetylornithine deacetylase
VRSLPGTTFERKVRAVMPECGALEVLKHTPPDLFPALPGFERAPVTFGSDAPRLRRLAREGVVALCGPGSIRVAHTADEHITGTDLRQGVEMLLRVADALVPQGAQS